MAETQEQPWGRADETGTVFVREGDEWREVGQFPDGTPDEALAYFERKFTDLAGQVNLLEQRAKRGAPAKDIAKAVENLTENLREPSAVGDIESLRSRVAALDTTVDELNEQQQAQAEEAQKDAIAQRETIVTEIEALAAIDPSRVQWKQMTGQVNDLFAQWQSHQQDGPRLPKAQANALWKRFRTARSTIEQERRAFFADLDAQHRDVKARKQELIEQAQALVPRGIDGVPGYRRLLDDWKRAGRAGKKQDDALWARFKAAGDEIYAAKAAVDARDDAEYRENYEKKLELLEEAEPLLSEKDLDKAKSQLLSVQRRWEEIGRVPRDKVKTVEDRLRRVEQSVRKLDDEHWRKNNPETKARTEGLASQLHDSIAKLESELADAETKGDRKRIDEANEALRTQRQWLNAIG
ncbi:DUF349 domain-containing protein [Paramicrobacterium chengjingii]|uniref:DUF349 domain-containing protein n=1 Tax=Paramicrobacterium chengjingii TaxID=2769067 RepID=A0ABX6YMQ0_9MICO|nr:DUF349 domain-containing protein [Microbacterium chengjingii]QPZ40008.1 DUF349 domain-containing protein [Microbacterium chengjingii]